MEGAPARDAGSERGLGRGVLPPRDAAPLLTASGAPDDPGANPDADQAPPPRVVSHFAGMMLDPAMVDVAALPVRLPSPARDGVVTSLEAVETVLSERAGKVGVEVRRGVAVSAVTPDGESVVVRAGELGQP